MHRPALRRRQFLAAAGGGLLGSLAGCVDRVWTQAEEPGAEQVAIRILTPPADDDAIAAKLSSRLRENAAAVGIDVTHVPLGEGELLRRVLLEREFDVVVVRHPGFDEFDALTGFLGSQFVTEAGWQNPFRYSDVPTDELLAAQRRTGTDRSAALGDLFAFLEETVPYTAIASPDELGAVRASLAVDRVPRRPLDYLDVLATQPDDGPRDGPLRLGAHGDVVAERLNPLVVDRNRIPGLVDLLYDPLVRRRPPVGDDPERTIPWLAASLEWQVGDETSVTVTLREDLSWHDGTALEAGDVAFTVAMLADTSRGDADAPIPAPRFRSRRTVIDRVRVLDADRLVFEFSDVTQPAAARALTIPVLPEHVWDDRTTVVADRRTQALVEDNDEPIGSGLVTVTSVADERIELEPFTDHVFWRSADDRPDLFADGFQFRGLTIDVVPNAAAMLDALRAGEIDLTVGTVPPGELDRLSAESEISPVVSRSGAWYLLGYDHTHPALGNPNFRRVFSQLIDRDEVVTTIFDDRATAATSRTAVFGFADDRVDDSVASEVADFPGSDGDLDVAGARARFADVGYQTEDETLLF